MAVRKRQIYRVLAFPTTHDAMAMEAYCAAHGIPGRLIPLPEEISAGCGLAWRMRTDDFDAFAQEIRGAGVTVERVEDVALYTVVRQN